MSTDLKKNNLSATKYAVFLFSGAFLISSCIGVGTRRSRNQLNEQSHQPSYGSSADVEKPSMDQQGFHLIEGDIIVNQFDSQGFNLAGAIKKDSNELWSNGTVFYRFDDKVLDKQKKKFREVTQVWEAGINIYLKKWDSNILVRFVEDTKEIAPNVLQVLGEQVKNSSYVGMLGGVQPFRLRPKATRRAIGHELGHALGLPHEHTRCDRHNYVAIMYDNIPKEDRKNFSKKCKRYRIVMNEYTVNSIMHYSHDSFSKNGLPTIVLKSDPGLKWEQPEIPSEMDFRTVALGYLEKLQAD